MTSSQHDSLAWIEGQLEALDARHLRRRLETCQDASAGFVRVDGRELINFGSNDYLGLAHDPRIAAAALAVAGKRCGAGASPLITGRSQVHERLEARLAEFEGTEAAILFPSGYAANLGTIAALVGRDDAVYSDAKNHASIIDGCRLSRAAVHVYSHRDHQALQSLLREGASYRRRLIVTETVFSMDGDLAPLVELADLAQRHECMLMVDEAHATGIFGARGRGLAEHLEVENRVDARVGTLSKALGAAGGFVCGKRTLIDWLANGARSYVFSTALPPALAAAAIAALDLVRDEPWRRTTLLDRAAAVRGQLQASGWQTLASASQIIPLVVGDAARAVALAGELRESGMLVPAIRPPSVPQGQSLLRVSLNWAHSPAMLNGLVTVLGRFADERGRLADALLNSGQSLA